MKRFFGTDSPSFRFMTILLELAEINLLFLLCSIPIVTIGAAYSAMLHSLYGMHKYGEGCFSVKMFFRVFRRSLKPLIPAWCVIVICYILLGCNINYIINNTQGMIRFIGCGVYIVLLLFVSGIISGINPENVFQKTGIADPDGKNAEWGECSVLEYFLSGSKI